MPRAGLTPPRVVAEAAAVADEVGLERLTLAAVAARLGVTLPSLYKHVRGAEGLRRDLSVRALDELTVELSRASVGTAGRDALQAVTHAYRRYAQRHPGLIAATLQAPDPHDATHVTAATHTLDVLTSTLREYRLDEERQIDAIRSLRAVLHGFVSLEAAGGFGLPQSVEETFERLVDGLDLLFTSWGTATSTDSP